MKFLSVLIVSLFCTYAFANDFDKESPVYDKKENKNDAATIQKKIEEDMTLACQGSMCTIAQKTTHNRGWSITFNVGQGGYGGGYGYGNGNGGGSTVIVGDPNFSNDPYYGVTLRYENYRCTSDTNIDRTMYETLKYYIANMRNEDGSVKRTFSPTEQATILQYVTFLSSTDGCRSNNGGSGGFAR